MRNVTSSCTSYSTCFGPFFFLSFCFFCFLFLFFFFFFFFYFLRMKKGRHFSPSWAVLRQPGSNMHSGPLESG